MLLHVLNAHTGQRYTSDSEHLTSSDTFKTWLAQASGVSAAHQILLSDTGKQVKLQSVQDGAEVFLYNRQLLSPTASTTSRRLSVHPPDSLQTPSLQEFPRDSVQSNEVEEWRSLFRARQNWAEHVQTKASSVVKEIANSRDALSIIQRGTEVALGNLQSHVRTLDQKYQEASTWASKLLQEQDRVIEEAAGIVPCLEALPAKTALLRYLPRLSKDDQVFHEDNSTLSNLAKPVDCHRNMDVLRKSQQSLHSGIYTLGGSVQDVMHITDAILQSVESTRVMSNKNNNAYNEEIEEIQVLVEKITSDYIHVDELIADGRLAGQAVRIASLQTKNYLPSMVEYYDEIVHGLQAMTAQRESFVQEALQNMQRIAKTEASFASANVKVSEFDLSRDGADAYEAISIASELPYAYGVLLIESVRRQEWSEKLHSESEILAGDMGGHKEEEEKRRKKWLKSNGHLVTTVPTGSAINFEVNLQHSNDELPGSTRADLSAYKQALMNHACLKAVSDKVSEAVEALDKTTKKQMKKFTSFKSGSVYDAGSSRSSFLSRDSGETTTLKEVNRKLEEEVKAQKSRVRKLEHLVFNQTQSIRSSSANLFQAPVVPRPESPVASPDPTLSPMPSPKSNVELLSRKASVNPRRASSNKPQDEKILARRIVTLEAEVYETAQKNQMLEKEKRQLQLDSEQAQLTHQDLLANMSIQQHEFADERRVLKEEVTDWKRKLEDVEDELERVVGSRENDRTRYDEKLGIARERIAEVEATIRRRQEEERDCKAALAAIQRNLQDTEDTNPELSITQTLTELVHKLIRLSDQASLHKLRLQEAVDNAKSENESLQSTLDRASNERERTVAQRKSLQRNHDQLAADLSAREARLATIEAELEDGRTQLHILRAKFADGETGSAVLQQRLEHQAAKATQAAADLAEAHAEVYRLKYELAASRSTQSDKGNELSAITERLTSRSIKDIELSHRLANYVGELSRLLEALGLSVLEREDGTMTIQRTSKLTSTSQTLSDLSSPTSASPLGRPFDLTIPQELLQWSRTSSLADENLAFGAFLSRLDALDLPALSDSILKLRRDVEWTGKKWKAEARSYRDKLHAATSDSTHKIAFRAFKEGDLALFLPTRNQAMRPWAAFNVGAPHYFLRETDSHNLQSREWLVARISKVQERVVDLSGKTPGVPAGSAAADTRSVRSATSSSAISFEDDNPFDLSDGLRWYLIDAVEEKTGNTSLSVTSSVTAPTNPPRHLRTGSSVRGKGTPTIGTACVDATGTSVKPGKGKLGDASTKLGQNLDSRRSSTASRAGSVRATRDGASDVSVRVDIPKKKSSMANVSALARGLLGADAAKKESDGDEVFRSGEDGKNDELRPQSEARPTSLSTTNTPASSSSSPQAPPMRRTISQSVKPTSTSAFFTAGVPNLVTTSARLPTSTTSTTTSSTKKTSPAKQDQRVTASTAQAQQKSEVGGGEEEGWKSLWSLDVNIEEEERRRR